MAVDETCKTEVISESECCTVTRCAHCHVFQLHIGPFSIKLREDMFGAICDTLMNARMLMLSEEQAKQSNALHH